MQKKTKPIKVIKRDKFFFSIAKFFAVWGYKNLTSPLLEEDNINDFLSLKAQNPHAVFLYTGLHKSLWETTGIAAGLYVRGILAPFFIMGDNLVKGSFFRTITMKTGTILIKRAKKREDIPKAALELKQIITLYMTQGIDILVFPEGTRTSIPKTGEYGRFFPTAFDALLDYEKMKIAQTGKTVDSNYDFYIIPCNVDYSNLREANNLTRPTSRKAQTLRIWDSLKMIRHVREVFISFGAPIKVSDHINKNRKELANYSREKCLDLVKILTVNVVSKAILDTFASGPFQLQTMFANITRTVQRLQAHAHKFRGFSLTSSPQEIYAHAVQIGKIFDPIKTDNQALYALYAGYIGHYFV